MKQQSRILIVSMALILTLSGCGISVQGGNSGKTVDTSAIDGGVFRSDNKGVNWLNKSLIATVSGKPGSFNSVSGNFIMADPTDLKTLYFGSVGEGLFYSYDRGESWQRSNALGKVTVLSIAVDPTFRCTIYATMDNKIKKSIDCGRAWTEIYSDNDVNLKINSLVLNNKGEMFMGTSRGEIMKSLTRGDSWQVLTRFKNKVLEIKLSPFNNDVMFVANERRGLQQSLDGGVTWQSLEQNLKDLGGTNNFKELTFSGTTAGTMYLANGYGIAKSTDNGKAWTKINLITPEANATINSLTVNPKNDQEIYYLTNTTFYKSIDGGANWTSKKIPSTRHGVQLLVDPTNQASIYMIVKAVKKQ